MFNKQLRIYIDGIYDLFHGGHLDSLQKAKNYSNDTFLIVGLISDIDSKNYKRDPIINQNERYQILSNLKIVDQVIFPAPLYLDNEFIKKHNIDIVLHCFSDLQDYEKQKDFYKEVENIFHQLPYSEINSTSKIIKKIKDSY